MQNPEKKDRALLFELRLRQVFREMYRPSLFAGTAFYWMACVAFALLQAVMLPVYWMLSGVFTIDATGFSVAVQVLFYLGVLFLPVVLYILSHPGSAPLFRLNPVSPGKALLSVVAAGAGFLAANMVTLLWMLLLEQLGANVSTDNSSILFGNLLLDIFMVAVIPGICEELLFRGMVLVTYERWGTWKAIWIAALLFMGLHGSVTGAPAELMLGVVLGYVTAVTNSLYAAMMLHTAYNAVTLFAGYSAMDTDVVIAGTLVEQLGGPGGVLVVALMAIVCVLALFVVLCLMGKLCEQKKLIFGDAKLKKEKLSKEEIVLLFSAVGTLAWFYLQDIAQLGGLR